jgi:hypothetical protein
MIRAVVWAQVLFILSCVGYSTYCLFQGDFEKGLLPYPVLILYYLIFSRRKIKKTQPSEGQEPRV